MKSPLRCAPIAAGLVFVVGQAEAAPPEAAPYVLTYAAPDVVCPGEARFISEVASHVHDTSRAWSVRVNVTIEPREAGYAGALVAYDRAGRESSRRLVDSKCSDLASALAFLAALVIELGGHTEPEAPPATNSAPAPAASLPSRSPPTSSDSAAPLPRPFPLAAVLLGGARGGLGPSVHASGEVGVEVGASRGVLGPSLRLVALLGNGSLDGAGGSAALWLMGGRLELCPLRFGAARFAVRPCLGTEVGVVYAEGQTPYAPRRATEPWISVEATLRVQWFATRSWFLELGGGPVLPLERTHYYFEPDRSLYTVPVVTARAAMGIGAVF